jgi:hypothetical protein
LQSAPLAVADILGREPLIGTQPMKAQLVDSIRPGDWIYEIKFDATAIEPALPLKARK